MTQEEMSKVLAHQLEGIMFHADAFAVSCLNGYDNLRRMHYHQAMKETDTHMRTVMHFIDSEDMMVAPGQLNRVVLSEDATRSDILKAWRKWEMDTKAMYLRLIEEEPECHFWVKLYKAALHEIACIDCQM